MASLLHRHGADIAVATLPLSDSDPCMTPSRLADVAAEVNERPRKTLGWATPARLLEQFTAEPTGCTPAAGLGGWGCMADMRRHGPEPAVGLPQVQHKPA